MEATLRPSVARGRQACLEESNCRFSAGLKDKNYSPA
jgi:hypothetical protein